jgi:hypothetical protein
MSKYDLIKFIETVSYAFLLTPEQEHTLVKKAISYCCDENLLKEKQLYYKHMSQTCQAILKSGKNAGNLCSQSAKENGFCLRHSKHISVPSQVVDKPVKKKIELRPTDIVLRKNNFGNIVYPNTNLILDKDNKIIAKQDKQGEWTPLNDEDIEICKKLKLRYKIIDFTFKGEFGPEK